MSYARFGWDDSDVYLFFNTDGKLECCFCALQKREWVDDPNYPIIKGYLQPVGEIVPHLFDSTRAMLDHLERHQTAGHNVPQSAIDDIKADDAENFGASA